MIFNILEENDFILENKDNNTDSLSLNTQIKNKNYEINDRFLAPLAERKSTR